MGSQKRGDSSSRSERLPGGGSTGAEHLRTNRCDHGEEWTDSRTARAKVIFAKWMNKRMNGPNPNPPFWSHHFNTPKAATALGTKTPILHVDLRPHTAWLVSPSPASHRSWVLEVFMALRAHQPLGLCMCCSCDRPALLIPQSLHRQLGPRKLSPVSQEPPPPEYALTAPRAPSF